MRKVWIFLNKPNQDLKEKMEVGIVMRISPALMLYILLKIKLTMLAVKNIDAIKWEFFIDRNLLTQPAKNFGVI